MSKKHQDNFTGTDYVLLNLLLQQANFMDTNTGEKEAVYNFESAPVWAANMMNVMNMMGDAIFIVSGILRGQKGMPHVPTFWPKHFMFWRILADCSWLHARDMAHMTLWDITGKQSASTSKAKRRTYTMQTKTRKDNTDTVSAKALNNLESNWQKTIITWLHTVAVLEILKVCMQRSTPDQCCYIGTQ